MKLKKITIVAASAIVAFSMGGCGEKEQQQPEQQQSQTTMKQEQPTEEKSKLTTNEKEILEKFPKLKEMEDYLFEHYSTLNKEIQEKTEDKKTKPIEFNYTFGGGETTSLGIVLNFNELTTKKEMVEAMKYVSEQTSNLLLQEKQMQFFIEASIAFSGNKYIEKYWEKRGSIRFKYDESKVNGKSNLVWQEETAPLKLEAFNPEEVKEGEVVAYFEGEPPTQTANNDPQPTQSTSGLTMSTVMETLSQFGIEETTNKEATDGYFSIGSDATGLTSYMAGVYTDGTIQSVTYIATKVEGMTDEKFATSAGLYLMMCARIPYGDTEKGGEATTFVMDNMEAALQGEQTTTIDDWKLTLSYIAETNIFSLEFSK